MKLNRTYYRHLLKSFVIVAAGLVIILKEAYPMGAVSDNYFVLLMVILSGFFGLIGLVILFFRIDKLKFRRKFVYTFFGVVNFCIGLVGVAFALMHRTAGMLAFAIYFFGFLVGFVILADVFFGKRNPKQEREMLIT